MHTMMPINCAELICNVKYTKKDWVQLKCDITLSQVHNHNFQISVMRRVLYRSPKTNPSDWNPRRTITSSANVSIWRSTRSNWASTSSTRDSTRRTKSWAVYSQPITTYRGQDSSRPTWPWGWKMLWKKVSIIPTWILAYKTTPYLYLRLKTCNQNKIPYIKISQIRLPHV